MRRRALLALTGSGIAGFAGCLSGPSGQPTTGTTMSTPDETPTRTTTADRRTANPTATTASVSVALDALQPGLVTMNSPDSIAVHPTDGRYLFLDVTAEGETLPPPEEFSFRFAGADHAPTSMEQSWRYWRFRDEQDPTYDAASGEGLLLFELPKSANSSKSADSPEAALTWPGGEWRPDESLRRRLAAPEPSLSVSVEIPEVISSSESPTVSLTVQNQDDVTGRFVAGLNRAGPFVAHAPVTRISFRVPARETKTWELTDDSLTNGDYPDGNVGDGEPDMTYYLSWPGERAERDVRYAD